MAWSQWGWTLELPTSANSLLFEVLDPENVIITNVILTNVMSSARVVNLSVAGVPLLGDYTIAANSVVVLDVKIPVWTGGVDQEVRGDTDASAVYLRVSGVTDAAV